MYVNTYVFCDELSMQICYILMFHEV